MEMNEITELMPVMCSKLVVGVLLIQGVTTEICFAPCAVVHLTLDRSDYEFMSTNPQVFSPLCIVIYSQVLGPGCPLQLADDAGDDSPVVVDSLRLLPLCLHQVVEGLRLRPKNLLVNLNPFKLDWGSERFRF